MRSALPATQPAVPVLEIPLPCVQPVLQGFSYSQALRFAWQFAPLRASGLILQRTLALLAVQAAQLAMDQRPLIAHLAVMAFICNLRATNVEVNVQRGSLQTNSRTSAVHVVQIAMIVLETERLSV